VLLDLVLLCLLEVLQETTLEELASVNVWAVPKFVVNDIVNYASKIKELHEECYCCVGALATNKALTFNNIWIRKLMNTSTGFSDFAYYLNHLTTEADLPHKFTCLSRD
jgi:hypothetical protein